MEEEENKQRQEKEELLLEGVLTINDAALSTVETWDRLELLEMMKMWKTTHTSAPFVADNVGHRLGYYFWRLWWSERMLQSFSASQIYTHVRAINEGGNIRTTPRGSPRASKDLQIYFTAPQTAPDTSTAAIQMSSSMPRSARSAVLSPSSTVGEDDDGTATPTALSPDTGGVGRSGQGRNERRKLGPARPPPILKKAGSSGSSRSTSSRSPVIGTPQVVAESHELDPKISTEASPAIGGDQTTMTTSMGSSPPPHAQRYISTRFSEQVAVSIPHPPSGTVGERSSRSFGDTSRGSGKRGHIVHSGSVASRKRPILMRHRSSQASPSAEKPSPTSPRLGPQPQPQPQKKTPDDEGLTMPMTTERRKRAVSPHPNKQVGQASLTMLSDEDDAEKQGDSEVEEVNEDEQEVNEETEAAEQRPIGQATEGGSSTQTPSPLTNPTSSRLRSADQARPQQQHRSFTNLPSAAWRSTTSTPTASSYNASGMMIADPASSTSSSGRRGSVRAAFKDEIIPLKAPAPAGPDITDNVEADDTALPRTKSQLTFLLERNKAAGQDPKGKSPAKQ